jgi:hypothetical protein
VKKIYTLIMCLFIGLISKGNGDPIGGARALSIGGASATLQDHWAVFHNQAGLIGVKEFSAGVFFQNNFLLTELSTRGAAIALPVGDGVFGLAVRNFGYSLYNEGTYGLAYARKLSESLSVGVQINYLNMRIAEDYGTRSTFVVAGGFQYRAGEHVSIAGHLYNPSRSQLTEFNDERIPTLLSGAVQYTFSDRTFMVGQVVKEVDKPASFRFGVEYRLVDRLLLRAGAGTEPTQTSFGLGIDLNQFRIDLGSGYNNILGYIPQISLSYHAK